MQYVSQPTRGQSIQDHVLCNDSDSQEIMAPL